LLNSFQGINQLSQDTIVQKTQDQNLDWLNQFAKGLELLGDYDHENLDKHGLSKRKSNYPRMAIRFSSNMATISSNGEPQPEII